MSVQVLVAGPMADPHVLTMCANVARELQPSTTCVIINKIQLSALLDSCGKALPSPLRLEHLVCLRITRNGYITFFDKIRPLVENTKFPLETKVLEAFKQIKQELELATLKPIDESLPFKVECDASDGAISAALNQSGRPVAFMSKTLQGSELKYHIIEEEVMAIVEAVRKWSHYLTCQHFTLITDQRSVAFMFSNEK